MEGQTWRWNLRSFFFNTIWLKIVLPFGDDATTGLGMEWYK